MHKTTKTISLLVLILVVLATALFCLRSYLKNDITKTKEVIGNHQSLSIANPASVYCSDNGGKSEIRNNEEGQYGVCIFPDASECDEWKFFRKECGIGDSKISPEQDLELLKQVLIEKDKIDLEKVDVFISSRVDNFVSGSISPKEDGVGGAYFFAVKSGGIWQILASGNGEIKCEYIKDYPNFPISMIPSCVAENGELERRDLPL